MNTAEKLQKITDRGKFELLIMPILRHCNKDYRTIIHIGVNTTGETIISPIDGVCIIPESNPPHYVMVECTTTDISSLETKWLSEGKSRGDLIKAHNEAKKLKEENPDAKFTIVLATNERLKGHELYSKTMNKALQLGLNCDIWEQSRLRDFLDSTPEGHWLRKEHLGINAEMLSASLLSDLCKQNLKIYEEDLFTDTKSFINREVDNIFQNNLFSKSYSLELIVGESGFGKSVITYKALKQFINNGGYGLWIPVDIFEECLTVENCIDKVLKGLCPTLSDGAAKTIPQIIKNNKNNSNFTIVVDDINRSQNAFKCFQKIISRSKSQINDIKNSSNNGQSSIQKTFKYTFVCPVWPKIFQLIQDEITDKSWANISFVKSMTASEGKNFIKNIFSSLGKNISDEDSISLSEKMRNDPILLGLFASLITTKQMNNLDTLSDNVIEKFIEKEINTLANQKQTYLPDEYHEVLSSICQHMLINKKLYPSWNTVECWENGNLKNINILRELIHHSKLCRLSNNKLEFRHDRIQEALLVKTMVSILEKETGNFETLLTDPFFSTIIGKALLQISGNDKLLEFLKDCNILAIFEAIRLIGNPQTNFQQRIFKKAKQWSNEKLANNKVPNSELGAICWTLIGTDSSEMLKITEKFPKWPLLLLARLRNGDILSGILYCKNRHHFEPGVNNKLRDQIIKKAKSQHLTTLAENLRQFLRSSEANDEIKTGALIMAGFLATNDLAEYILICWNNITNKTDFIEEAIWAMSQCCANEPEKYLTPMIECWTELHDKEGTDNSKKSYVAENLRFAIRKNIHNNIIKFFITCCDKYDSLRWPITYILHETDDPDSIEYIVKYAADIERRLEGTDKFSFFTVKLTDTWNKQLNRGQRLSEGSLSRLKILWKNLNTDEYLKKQAFRLWLTSAETKDIDTLKSISDKPLVRSALLKRVELGDHSSLKDFISILLKDPYLFKIAHLAWCEELINPADQMLEEFKDNIPKDFSGGHLDPHYALSRFLMMIPNKSEAEKLLDKYWEHLQYSGLFIQAALYIGTPRCLELVRLSIKTCPTDAPIFKHLSSNFGFMETGRHELLNLEHLENIKPYLNRLDKYELWQCAEVCQRLGYPEWSKQHLYEFLDKKERKRYHPSESDLLEELDKIMKEPRGINRISFWVEDFEKRHETQNIKRIIDSWLSKNTSIKGLEIISSCLEIAGSRKDLLLLDKYEMEGDKQEIEKIKRNVHFSVYKRTLE